MKTIKNGIAVLVSSLLVAGCATIAGDNTRCVKVNSYPSGANICLDNQNVGITPAIITLPTYIYGGKCITLKKQGYQEQSTMINSKFQPIALLDILFWPTFFVDALTGSLVKIDPCNRCVNATLHRC